MMSDSAQLVPVEFVGDELRLRFDDAAVATAGGYARFLQAKKLPESRVICDEGLCHTIAAPARFAGMLGEEVPDLHKADLPMAGFLYEDQAAITWMALDAKRFATWADCGWGKTPHGFEFLRHVVHRTGKRALIITLAEVIPQMLDEAVKFYGDGFPIVRLHTREQMREWCAHGSPADGTDGPPAMIAITNYEKFNHKTEAEQVVPEIRLLGGVWLDESSRLKGGGGKQKWALIKSCRGVEYKLSTTATPAPNELMEFASQASFLEKMRAKSVADAVEQIIWTYFTRDPKTHRWSIKQHARAAFFEWMSSWSIYLRDPRKFGWRVNMEPPPPPERFVHLIEITDELRDFILDHNAAAVAKDTTDTTGTASMFVEETNATGSIKLSQAAKGFVYQTGAAGAARGVRRIDSRKPAFIADLVTREVRAGHQVLVWTIFDEESAILEELIRAHPKMKAPASKHLDVLTGKTKEADRLQILDDFRRGDCRVLISRAAMLGYGMNFQMCTSMVFSGWSFSYEQFYQAVRRAYRQGQTKAVRVHIPVIPELEGQMLDAIGRKEQQHEKAIEEMEQNYIAAMAKLGLRKSA